MALQDTNSEGYTIDKSEDRAALSKEIMALAAALGVITDATGNAAAEETVRITRSALDEMGEDAFSGRVTNILDLATANMPALLPYGFPPPRMAAIQALFQRWRSAQGIVRNAQASGQKGTKAIARIIPGIDEHLEDTMDRLVTIIGTSNPGFADGWATVREIVDPANPNPRPGRDRAGCRNRRANRQRERRYYAGRPV